LKFLEKPETFWTYVSELFVREAISKTKAKTTINHPSAKTNKTHAHHHLGG